jgi:hypothetical protein
MIKMLPTLSKNPEKASKNSRIRASKNNNKTKVQSKSLVKAFI